MTVVVDVARARVSVGERTLFADLSVTVTSTDRIGVVGINGTGKSTLLRVMVGTQEPDAGEVRRGRGTRTGVLDQEARLPPGTVGEVVGPGWEAQAVLDRLGMGQLADRDVATLSGGQAKRVALARALVQPAELLVLDEPTNHLDIPTIAWLEAWLSRFKGGVVLVSHDRHLLDRVTTRMIELDRGRAYVHEGGYASYLAAKAERAVRAVEAEAVRANLARRELAWLRRGAPARTRKPQARVDAARRLLSGGLEAAARPTDLEMGFDMPRLGNKVIEANDVAFGYGHANGPVLSHVSLGIGPGERLGVLGANGEGKSTLLELLAGRLAPTAGRVGHGPTVSIGYYAQQPLEFDHDATVRELVAGPMRQPGELADRRLMDRFWFTGQLQWATAGTLSGGERRRLQLLMVLAGRPNVLLLDEPTNDLDLDTLRVLEDFLEGWPGALVTVSHDRAFLERVTDRVVACRAGRVDEVPGGLAAWVADSTAARAPTEGAPARAPGGAARGTAEGGRGGAQRPKGTGRSASTLSFKLRAVDKELERLTRQRDRLLEVFRSTGDHQELARAGTELAAAQAELDEAEQRWLALAEEAEAGR